MDRTSEVQGALFEVVSRIEAAPEGSDKKTQLIEYDESSNLGYRFNSGILTVEKKYSGKSIMPMMLKRSVTEEDQLITYSTDSWRDFADSIKEIAVDEEVATISAGAFANLPNLEKASLPGVVVIGPSAFRGCVNLKTVIMPEVVAIQDGAFLGCQSLDNTGGKPGVLVMPKLSFVGDVAFQGCRSIRKVMAKSLSNIGAGAFMWCYGLDSVSADEDVSTIGAAAFSKCKPSISLTVSENAAVGPKAFPCEVASPTMPDAYTALDLETTSLSENAEIIEIGAVKVRCGQVVGRFSTLVKPKRHSHIPNEASAVNHIYDEDVFREDVPEFSKVAAKLIGFISGDTIIGQNIVGFDLPILQRHLEDCGKRDALRNDVIDTLDMARARKGGSCELPSIYRWCVEQGMAEMEDIEQHRAGSDALMAAMVYEWMKRMAEVQTGYAGTAPDKPKKEKKDSRDITQEQFLKFKQSVTDNMPTGELEALKPRGIVDESDPLFGKTVCITGDFTTSRSMFGGISRDELRYRIADHGAINHRNVKKTTDIVVYSNDTKDSIENGGSPTGSMKKAEACGCELLDEGAFVLYAGWKDAWNAHADSKVQEGLS